LKENARLITAHPHIERIMQEEITQHGADHRPLGYSLLWPDQLPIGQLHRRGQPARDVQHHPLAVRVLPNCPHQQLSIKVVKTTGNVEMQSPVVAPAAPSRYSDGLDRRLPRSISIGVGMENRFHQRLQVPFDHHLGDPVRDSRNAYLSVPALALRNLPPSHRRREVTPRGHPIPELVEVIGEIPLKLRNGLLIDSGGPLIGAHPLVGFPYLTLGNRKGLGVIHGAPPVAGWPPHNTQQGRPFGPGPLQPLLPYYERLRPCAPPRYSPAHGGCPLAVLPSHRSDRFPRSAPEPRARSRRLHAGRHVGSTQAPPTLLPG